MRVNDDFANIHIPEEKDPKKYTVAERRAEEYQMLIKAGTFRILHTIKLAERYGLKSHNSIARDRRKLQAYLEAQFKKARVVPDVLTKKYWALDRAQKASDYKAVSQISDSILEMAFNLGVLDKTPEKVQQVGGIKFVFETEKPGKKQEKPEKSKKKQARKS